MNKVFIIGNVTHTPESRTSPNGVSFTNFTVAVNRGRDKDAMFYRVTAWRQLGENCARFLDKGRKVAVVGELDVRTYEGRDGSTKVSLDVTAGEVEFLSPRNAETPDQQAPTQTPDGFDDVTDDSDLPF